MRSRLCLQRHLCAAYILRRFHPAFRSHLYRGILLIRHRVSKSKVQILATEIFRTLLICTCISLPCYRNKSHRNHSITGNKVTFRWNQKPSHLGGKWSHGQQYTPMSFARAATGLRSSATNFLASRRISMMLLSRANSGASGNDATNSVTNPNWITAHSTNEHYTQLSKAMHTTAHFSRMWSL